MGLTPSHRTPRAALRRSRTRSISTATSGRSFTDTCFACHRPRQERAQGQPAPRHERRRVRGAEDGKRHVIVPGKTAESEVFRRVSTKDSDDLKTREQQAPPSGRSRSSRSGSSRAEYKALGSSRPRAATTQPTPDDVKEFGPQPIDVFVLTHLKEAELKQRRSRSR